MSLRHILGYRLITTGHRLYGRLFNWRTRDAQLPYGTLTVAQATDGTEFKLTYAISCVSDFGDTLTYDVDFGDASGHATTASGSHTYSSGGLKTITAVVTDPNGSSITLTGSAVADTASTDMSITSLAFDHTDPAGTVIGTLSTTDVDAGDTFTYTLVAGTGSTDNALFDIVGADLVVGASPVAAGTYSVRIRSTDQTGQTFEKVFAPVSA